MHLEIKIFRRFEFNLKMSQVLFCFENEFLKGEYDLITIFIILQHFQPFQNVNRRRHRLLPDDKVVGRDQEGDDDRRRAHPERRLLLQGGRPVSPTGSAQCVSA